MKLLFLDIDGVMNTDFHYVRSDKHPDLEFDPEAIKTLEDVIIETDCKIIISSSWRKSRTVAELKEIFSHYGEIISKVIVGKTGNFPRVCQRQDEIKLYLEYYKNDKKIEVESFVVIDDEVEYDIYDLPNNTVSTKSDDGLRGLRYYMKEKIINILNS
jgi:histidinol phosphatase-like enzyme